MDRASCRGGKPLEVRPSHIDLRSHRIAVWLALIVTVLWSSSWVLIRWGLDDEGLPPVTFAALRYGLAAIVLVGWVIFRERHRRHEYSVDRRYVVQLVLLGVILYGLTQGAIFVALDAQPAARRDCRGNDRRLCENRDSRDLPQARRKRGALQFDRG